MQPYHNARKKQLRRTDIVGRGSRILYAYGDVAARGFDRWVEKIFVFFRVRIPAREYNNVVLVRRLAQQVERPRVAGQFRGPFLRDPYASLRIRYDTFFTSVPTPVLSFLL